MRAQYWLAFVCLFCIHLTFAQDFRPGYIKLKDGADQHGLIGKTVPSPESIEFKADATADIVLYPASEVSGYGIENGIYYSSFQEPGRSLAWNFVEILVEGDLVLLKRNGFYFLVDRSKHSVVHLNERHRTKMRSIMIKGCPFVASQSMKVDRTDEGLAAHVKAYNNCVAVKKPNYDGLHPSFSIGIVAGFDNSKAAFDGYGKRMSAYLTGGPLVDKSFFQGGIDVTFRKASISNYFSLYSGLLYNSNNYSQSNKIVFPKSSIDYKTLTEYNQYSIQFSQIKMPLGVEFSTPTHSKIQPYVRAGIVFSKTVSMSLTRSLDIDPNSNGNIYAATPPKLNSFNVAPLFEIAAGLDYRVVNNHSIRFQLGYNSGKAITNTGTGTGYQRESASGRYTSFNGMVGFIF